MSQRESSELNELVDWYIAVWHEPDAELRRKRIAELWVEDGVQFTRSREIRGYKALEERVEAAHEEFVQTGGFVFRLTGLPALFLWGGAAASIFTPQQHRLLSLAPAHVNVILALNNAALYLGTAGGAMLGGVALHVLPVTKLGWVGASFALLALLLLLLSLRVSATGSGSRDALIEDLPGKERTTLIERVGTLRKTQARLRETEKGNTS